jgi:GT2 family glycosyltransferase
MGWADAFFANGGGWQQLVEEDMSRRLDIGIASYGSTDKLLKTISTLRGMAQTDWRCLVIDNPGPDARTRDVISELASSDPRIVPVFLDANVGYAGAVSKLMELAETEYIAYCDNDVVLRTAGWDEIMCSYLDRFHEIGIVFPNGGAAPIMRGAYREILWAAGFCWVLSRMCMSEVGKFDTSLGHQEEADYCLRIRMAGWRCAAAPEVEVDHDATASNDPRSIERINRGVINFVNKWCRYFGGKNLDYYSPNVLRFEDWPPNTLYLEDYWRERFPELNAAPEVVRDGSLDYDLIRVPRRAGYYRGRVI